MKQREHEVLQQLSQADLRITPQRRCLVQEILRLPEHFSADELLDHMRGEGNRVSRATLYRLLPALVQIGVLREVLYGEEHSHYEVVYEEEEYDPPKEILERMTDLEKEIMADMEELGGMLG